MTLFFLPGGALCDDSIKVLGPAFRAHFLVPAVRILFLIGGVAGAFGFKAFGYRSTVPLALVLAALAIVPAIDNLRHHASLQGGP